MADAEELVREPVFVALTRPQMFAGVTYTFFIINALISMEAFLITRSFWVILFAVILHGLGGVACLQEPRIFDLWILRVRRCPRLANFKHWQCNSYAP